jgi:hypothetical protein
LEREMIEMTTRSVRICVLLSQPPPTLPNVMMRHL